MVAFTRALASEICLRLHYYCSLMAGLYGTDRWRQIVQLGDVGSIGRHS